MKKIVQYAFLAVAVLAYAGCSREETLPDTPIVGLGGDTWVKGEIDFWLETEFLDPYNIEVKYKWDPYEVNYLRNMVPIREDLVKTVLSAVKDIWLLPYEGVAGETFIKTYTPRQFVLAGSAEYNTDGTIVLGQAEGGRKILLFQLNSFDPGDLAAVQTMLHTIHHEFAHILHQNILYPVEWRALNPEWYTASWYNNSDEEAHRQGLISAYAKLNADEDFVETISFLLVYGQEYYDSVIAREDVPDTAKEILRTKRQMVIDYFETNYGTDFLLLQERTQAAIAAYID